MAARRKTRQFPTAFKFKAIKRAEGGGGVLPVARKLGISRKLLHDWIKGLNRKRGPKPGPRKLKPLQADDKKRSALAQASARIAEPNGWWAASRWTSIFAWSGRQRKANPHPRRQSKSLKP
ncbi:transposase [Bradyrhizobium sp. TZ2]